jgi:2-amino-4-hydroxy-6-hydroxymethyldihydropteridine diphosphokinase
VRYWIGLGSNLGNRLDNLRQAAERLSHLSVSGKLDGRSRVFASAAVGGPPQPTFLNAAVAFECALEPGELLARCFEIELAAGRTRSGEVRWGPRVLDVDVLLIGTRGQVIVETPALVVPHPRLHERAFALVTLTDLDVGLVHPTLRRPLTGLFNAANQLGQPIAPTGDLL